jgi:cell division protein FtsB
MRSGNDSATRPFLPEKDSTMSLIEVIQAAQDQETTDAWNTYCTILATDDPKPAEVRSMRAAMATLGKTIHDLPEDRNAVAEIPRLRKIVGDNSGLPAQLAQLERKEAECGAEREKKIAPHLAVCVRKSWVQCDEANRQIESLSAPHDKIKRELEELRGRVKAHERYNASLRQLEGSHHHIAKRLK